MVVDEIDQVGLLLLCQFLPGNTVFFHFLLGSRMGPAVGFEVVETELDGAGEDIVEVGTFGDLEDEGGIGC